MEQNEAQDSLQEAQNGLNTTATATLPAPNPPATITSQAGCSTCGPNQGPTRNGSPNFVYVLGKVKPLFPSLSVEKEYAQCLRDTETTDLTDEQTTYAVLSRPESRYVARQLCWVLTVEGIETYILRPTHPADFDLLIETLKPDHEIEVVIGVQGPLSPPETCNGLTLPILFFDQMYSFDMDSLIKSIERPKEVKQKEFTDTIKEVFKKIKQMADNAGATDGHRALNYLTVRYQAIYAQAAESFAKDYSLSKVDVRVSRLSGIRKIIDVVFSYTSRKTDVTEKYFLRVDVTEEFPFLVTKLSPYYIYDQNP